MVIDWGFRNLELTNGVIEGYELVGTSVQLCKDFGQFGCLTLSPRKSKSYVLGFGTAFATINVRQTFSLVEGYEGKSERILTVSSRVLPLSKSAPKITGENRPGSIVFAEWDTAVVDQPASFEWQVQSEDGSW